MSYYHIHRFAGILKPAALFLIATLCFSSLCTAQASLEKKLRKGKIWIVDSIFVDKVIDGVSVVKNSTSDTVKTFLRLPKRIIIESKKEITFEYADGIKKSGDFIFENNKIIVNYLTHRVEYEIEPASEGLKISNSIKYVIDGVRNAEERYTIKLVADKQNK